MAELFKGQAGSPITYLTSDISANQTTISIDDDSALPDAPNICTIGYGEHLETIKYETKSNGVLQNVTRGIEGTPRAWQAGTEVARFFTAYDHNAIIEDFVAHKADYANLFDRGEVYNLTLINNWYGMTVGDFSGIEISKNSLGSVTVLMAVRCNIESPTRTTISTLPSGYRPSAPVLFRMLNNTDGSDGGIFYISTNGEIRTLGSKQANKTYFGMISFPTIEGS